MSVLRSLVRFIDWIAENTQTVSWTIMRVLGSAMFMTHGR